ncbi:hypothetical protein [Streptomyces sp. NPDC056549]|uniref:hypothetical protein n=1 Tax=Streptomyces sp. NPDC056549 TaxID=3345864 RepID=UPI00367BD1FC
MTDRQHVYRHIVVEGRDFGTASAFAVLAEDPSPARSQRVLVAASQVQAVFDRFPHVASVLVYVEHEPIGVAVREDYPSALDEPSPDDIEDQRSGEGDGATLTGPSLRYEVHGYTCPSCGTAIYTTAPTAPVCPDCEVSAI